MELDKAIERVGELLSEDFGRMYSLTGNDWERESAQALALVLEAAKRPGFTAEDAKWLKEQINPKQYYWSDQSKADALLTKLDAYLESSHLTK